MVVVHRVTTMVFKCGLEHPYTVAIDGIVAFIWLWFIYSIVNPDIPTGRMVTWPLATLLTTFMTFYFVLSGSSKRVISVECVDIYAYRTVPWWTVGLLATVIGYRFLWPRILIVLRCIWVVLTFGSIRWPFNEVFLLTFLTVFIATTHRFPLPSTVAVYVVWFFLVFIRLTWSVSCGFYTNTYRTTFNKKTVTSNVWILSTSFLLCGFLVEYKYVEFRTRTVELVVRVLRFWLAWLMVGFTWILART